MSVAFKGALVLDLKAYAGLKVNLTICTVDYGNNPSAPTTYVLTIPKGEWQAIQLYQGWNLISLPLIPISKARTDVYSLVLPDGALGIKVTYGFDNAGKIWIKDPTTIEDGKGYWTYVESSQVLIVQGTRTPSPPATPTTYHLYVGWNLAGYTEQKPINASDYLASLEPGSHFRYIYIWDAENQVWVMVDTKEPTTFPYYQLSPGQGFWIYMYKEQDLIPPINP